MNRPSRGSRTCLWFLLRCDLVWLFLGELLLCADTLQKATQIAGAKRAIIRTAGQIWGGPAI